MKIPSLETIKAIVHGGELSKFSECYHQPEDKIIDFSSNINPLGPGEKLIRLFHNSVADLSRYPDASAEKLCRKIAGIFSVSPEEVIAGNGSMALLDLVVRQLLPKKALLIEPCFGEYRRLLQHYGAEVSSVMLKENNGFQLSEEEITAGLQDVDLAILGHPNNPTGTALSREALCSVLREADERNVFMIIDEAFVDWDPDRSIADQIRRFDHVVVVRSLTKFYSLAGLRIGFALGPRSLMGQMKQLQGPWNCNRVAQKLALEAFDDQEFQARSRQWLFRERQWFQQALGSLKQFKVYPSLANFLLVQSEKDLTGLKDFLGERGVYIREAVGFNGLDEKHYFRVAVLAREHNECLVRLIKEWSRTNPQ